MAEVFKAKAFGVEGFEKILAIKRILPSMAEDADFIQMFIDEAKIAGQLNHANIAQIFELGRVDDSHFIAMEYVWGKDLLQIQNRFRRVKQTMPFPMAAYCAAKMCEGLDYAHKKKDAAGKVLGIIHRDVSPQNVLCSYDGEIKVIDFGIAKAASRSTKTQAGVLKGKFGYMSPEQVRGLPLDRRSDVFAIATILYELLTAERLFLGESDFATLEKVRNVDVPPPSKVVPGCPPEIEKIILKGLAKDVEDRYQWAAEMQEDLQTYLNTLDPPFGLKQLAQWMREQFAPEIKRESQVLEEQKKMTREMKAPQIAAAVAGAPMPSGEQPHGTMELKAEDLDLQEEEDAPLAGEATQISSELPPEVRAVIEANAALAAQNEPKPLANESTQILGANHPSPSDMPSQATMLLDTGSSAQPAGGNGHNGGLPPLQGQSTVLLEAPVLPGGLVPKLADRTGQTALHPETSQVEGLPFRPKKKSSIAKDLLIGVVVAIAVIGGVLGVRTYLVKAEAKSTLVITVSPPTGAKVTFDNIDKGAIAPGAALTLKDLQPGPHTVVVKSDDGQFEQKVTLAANDVSVISAILEAKKSGASTVDPKEAPKTGPAGTGKLELKVTPEGATVFVDGAQLEEDAWRKDAIPLRAGTPHEFKVSKAGNEDSRFTITLKAGEEQKKVVELAAAVGHLEVKTEPAGADVNVNGKSAGVTPLKVDDVELGKDVRVTIRKHGFASVTKYVSFKEDNHQALDIKLSTGSSSSSVAEKDEEPAVAPKKDDEKKPEKDDKKPDKKDEKDEPEMVGLPSSNPNEPGFLVANTQPWAKVIIDGKDTGKTTPIAPRSKIPLKPGKHKVTFVANGKKYDYDIVVKPGEDLRLIRQLGDAP
jgi:serine/threonine protein kinase